MYASHEHRKLFHATLRDILTTAFEALTNLVNMVNQFQEICKEKITCAKSRWEKRRKIERKRRGSARRLSDNFL